jgi:hypothetical protein
MRHETPQPRPDARPDHMTTCYLSLSRFSSFLHISPFTSLIHPDPSHANTRLGSGCKCTVVQQYSPWHTWTRSNSHTAPRPQCRSRHTVPGPTECGASKNRMGRWRRRRRLMGSFLPRPTVGCGPVAGGPAQSGHARHASGHAGVKVIG